MKNHWELIRYRCYSPLDATNASKHSKQMIGQFVKFFF